MTFDEYFLEHRKRSGLSQQEIADKCGYSNNVIFRYENGQSLPSVSDLKMIADLFNVKIEDVIKHNEILSYSSKTTNEEIKSDSISKAIKYYRNRNGLSQTQLASLLGVSSKTISRFESGSSELDIEQLDKLANIFNVDYSSILYFNSISEKDMIQLENNNNVHQLSTKRKRKKWVLPLIISISILGLGAIIFGIAFAIAIANKVQENEDFKIVDVEVEKEEIYEFKTLIF